MKHEDANGVSKMNSEDVPLGGVIWTPEDERRLDEALHKLYGVPMPTSPSVDLPKALR